jgi:hypothetical protein
MIVWTKRIVGRAVALGMLAALLSAPLGACSASNREGPDVTCADLECGRINACQQGIIAQCADGVTVKFHVCTEKTTCEATWQKSGAYRCQAEQTDCEGCRPERKGCGDVGAGGQGGATSATGTSNASTTSTTSATSASGSGGHGGGGAGGSGTGGKG